jgi:hypothetical protein
MQRKGHPQRSSLWIYRVDPYEIHYVKFILEAHEGLATLTTLDPKEGLIQLAVPPGCDRSLEVLMEALCQELELERISPKC